MWPDHADEIIVSDHVFALGFTTPASGVIVSPMTNCPIRDRSAGALSNGNTSIGTWKKLSRIVANPRVALAFHSRHHSRSTRPEFVLLQGRASFPWPPPSDYVKSIQDVFEESDGLAWDNGPILNWWLRDWMWRVPIDVAVDRVVVWPDVACGGEPEVHGPPLPPEPPPSQREPKNGTEPRVNHRRAARRLARQPSLLLGWTGSDGYPVIAPVRVQGVDDHGISLAAAPGLVPPGSRRAGLTGHAFARYTHGQTLRKHTGWLDVAADGVGMKYAPHTTAGYWFPASKLLFATVAGGATRLGVRRGRRAGFIPATLKR